MKSKLLTLLALMLVSFTRIQTTDTSDKLIGTWKWAIAINSETNEEMGIEAMTMGMATEVKTEFKKDKTFVESKMRKGSTEYSTTSGEWKLESGDILNLKPKEKWQPKKILKLSNDSLLLQMNPQMNLLMIKQK